MAASYELGPAPPSISMFQTGRRTRGRRPANRGHRHRVDRFPASAEPNLPASCRVAESLELWDWVSPSGPVFDTEFLTDAVTGGDRPEGFRVAADHSLTIAHFSLAAFRTNVPASRPDPVSRGTRNLPKRCQQA